MEQSSGTPGSNVRIGAVLLLATFAVWGVSLGHEFVWDDEVVVVGNPLIRSWSHVGQIFRSSFFPNGSYYRPLSVISYLIDHSLWGLDPMGFHLTNVLIHGAGTYLLFLLLQHHFGTKAAFVSALLFCIHPIHSTAVNGVQGRSGLMEILLLGAVCSFRRAPDRPVFGLLTALLFGLGLLTKESVMIFPLLLGIYAYCYLTTSQNKNSDLGLRAARRHAGRLCRRTVRVASVQVQPDSLPDRVHRTTLACLDLLQVYSDLPGTVHRAHHAVRGATVRDNHSPRSRLVVGSDGPLRESGVRLEVAWAASGHSVWRVLVADQPRPDL